MSVIFKKINESHLEWLDLSEELECVKNYYIERLKIPQTYLNCNFMNIYKQKFQLKSFH